LRRAGVDEAVIEGTLAQLRQHGLLDDAAFAEYWVEQRQTFRPRGARLLRAELAQRGVPTAVAKEAASAAEPTAKEDAYKVAARRAVQLRHLQRPAFEVRLAGFLARRGFDWDTVGPVVQRLSSETFSTS
jgi:regulatory protein